MYETDKMAMNARLNWAENMLLSHEHARSKSQLAVVACIEPDVKNGEKDGFIRSLTFDQLYLEVAQLASALKKLGVGPGDRVAALIPNNAGARPSERVARLANADCRKQRQLPRYSLPPR